MQYDAIDDFTLEITTKRIIQWKELPFNKVKFGDLSSIGIYLNSGIRKETPSFSLFYLDRLYFSRYYNFLNEHFSDQVSIIMNMGVSAFRNNKKYCAFGLLSKCIDMTEPNSEVNKICAKVLNELIYTMHLSPALKNLILDYVDNELFEFLWILNDVDAFEHQLSEI